jgi:PAS domain S-box-containing protein
MNFREFCSEDPAVTDYDQSILLLEDDPNDQSLFSAMLRSTSSARVKVIVAERLSLGLRILEQTPPDLIVSDLNLPDSNGLETISAIQACAPHIPIVVLSGEEQEAVAIEALQCGAQEYLCKKYVDGPLLRRTVRYATERKRMDICLRQQRDFAEGLIEGTEAIIVLIDDLGCILRMNAYAARRLSVDVDSVLGKEWETVLIPEEERLEMREYVRTINDSPKSQFTCSRIVSDGDTPIRVRWAGRAIHDSGGRVSYLLLTGHDITELEIAQLRSLKAERLASIGRTMIGLSHESRNILQRSQACITLLDREIPSNPKAKHFLDRLQRTQDDLKILHDDLRDYPQPLHLTLTPCNLRDVVNEAWSNLSEERKDRDVCLNVETDGPDLNCQIDRFRIRRVFRNLLENSLNVCSDPVTIKVYWNEVQNNGQLALQSFVQDNGPGLTAEQQEKIFEVFYSSTPNGTGLGLPIARRIVEAHGGELRSAADSSVGATILFTLPRGSE